MEGRRKERRKSAPHLLRSVEDDCFPLRAGRYPSHIPAGQSVFLAANAAIANPSFINR